MDQMKHHSKLERTLDRKVRQACDQYGLLPKGARVLIGASGGKDSWALGCLLARVSEKRPDIALFAAHVDLGFEGSDRVARFAEEQFALFDIPFKVIRTSIASDVVLKNAGKRPCFLCARRRRERLVRAAKEFDCRIIALGHHLDDMLTSFLMNLLVNREISTITPSQPLFSGRFRIVRPLYLVDEKEILVLASELGISFVKNPCPVAGNSERARISRILGLIEREYPDARRSLFQALHNAKTEFLPRKILMDIARRGLEKG